jgi:hypothetical protein
MFIIIFLIPAMIIIKFGLGEMGIRSNSLVVNLTIMKALHMKIQVYLPHSFHQPTTMDMKRQINIFSLGLNFHNFGGFNSIQPN